MHGLLTRQLRRHFGGKDSLPESCRSFVDTIDLAYRQFDDDRVLLERSLELSSQELLQANSEMRAIFQALPDLFFRVDADGRILDCKGGAGEEFLIPPDRLLGRRIQNIPVAVAGEAFDGAIERARAMNAPVVIDYSLTIERRARFYEARVIPLPDSQFIVTVRNVTEHREAEAQLRQSQKIEAVGLLAGGIAHDFNNVLTAILGYAEVLSVRLGARGSVPHEVEQIRTAGRRASSLTSQLLAFSRKQLLSPRVLNLAVVVAEMEPMLRRLIGEDLDLCVVTEPELWTVSADPSQLEQVVLNLVINAREAMPGGGKLTIETRNVVLDEDYAYRHVGASAGPQVLLAVTDTGVGMDAMTASRVFEPFFTTKGPGKGTGLGLSTVYGIVKQSGGFIDLYSEPGVGTTFKVYLPQAVGQVAPAVKVTHADGVAPHGHETILLVEDEAQVRALARDALRMQGYTVLEASHGDEAIEISNRHPGPIQAMVTDIVMPRMNGREIYERLLPMRPDLRVLYMSGYTEGAIAHHGALDPGTAFLQKPFSLAALATKVREVLDAPTPQSAVRSKS
jgi:two-component system, cell cycle sensor histidine kinase and response regulator CckA